MMLLSIYPHTPPGKIFIQKIAQPWPYFAQGGYHHYTTANQDNTPIPNQASLVKKLILFERESHHAK
jgi:hypothetical protein